MTYSNKKIKSRKRIFIKPISNIGFDPAGFRSMARKTVKMCSIGRRKIGVFLSGGLDSSLIAYELKNIMGEANTFTNQMNPNIISGGENYNEDAICAQVLADQETLIIKK